MSGASDTASSRVMWFSAAFEAAYGKGKITEAEALSGLIESRQPSAG